MGHSVFHRTHRRITVVDEDVGWVGGMAVADAWWHGEPKCSKTLIHGSYKVRDTMLRIEKNPVVAEQLATSFNHLWDYKPGQQPSPQQPAELNFQTAQLNEMRVVPHSAQQRLFGKTLYSQIQAAKESAWLCTPYYIPTAKLHRALRRAAERGLDVRLVLPGYVTDHPMVRFASWHYYDKLLKSGVRVYEYQPAFMHAKAAVFDDEWVLMGSANLDRFSMLTNHEMAVEARMPSLNAQITQQFEVDFADSHEIKQEEWDQRCLSNRVLEKVCSPFQFAM
eukprot:TRINITY_DN3058_c0_g2_i2.p1 TRINITY_DN3058_c0_g2~~TRINITY_DN3058_c0_g2_i2.p1  ORF type:complete len:279 (+),score=71.11 TRINITY_DN3058_c0_g2_i2:337-1173(+)